jgi:hypothetical protein
MTNLKVQARFTLRVDVIDYLVQKREARCQGARGIVFNHEDAYGILGTRR